MSRVIPWRADPSKRAAFIDGDGILYSAALRGQTEIDGEPVQLLSEEEVIAELQRRVAKVVDEDLEGATSVFLVLSARHNFRYDILPSYKSNRKGGPRPLMLDFLRDYAVGEGIDGIKTMLIKNLEADDVLGIASGQFQKAGYETVIWSPDKDMLTVPGMLVTPRMNKAPLFSEITEERADEWHLYQTLMGDTTDGYKGAPGWGPKKAMKLIEAYRGQSPVDRWEAVVAAFEGDEEAALAQARVARILRYSDWDQEKKEPILWQPPRN